MTPDTDLSARLADLRADRARLLERVQAQRADLDTATLHMVEQGHQVADLRATLDELRAAHADAVSYATAERNALTRRLEQVANERDALHAALLRIVAAADARHPEYLTAGHTHELAAALRAAAQLLQLIEAMMGL